MTDETSALFRAMTGALGAGHPIRLLVAVSASVIVKTVVSVFARLYPEFTLWIALNEFALYWYILMIAPLLFIPMIVGRRGAPEVAVHQVNTVKLLLDQAGLSRAQRQLIWRAMIEKYLSAMQPDLSKPPPLSNLFKEAMSDLNSPAKPAP